MSDSDRTASPPDHTRHDGHQDTGAPGNDADEPVGYGRPPRRHQFRKGQSGNPKGRPRGSKNLHTILDRALTRRINVKDRGGRTRTVSVAEAMTIGLTQRALTSDRAMRLVLELAREVEAQMTGSIESGPSIDELKAEDAAILARHLGVRAEPGGNHD